MYCALSGDNIYVYVVVIGTKLIQLLTQFFLSVYIYIFALLHFTYVTICLCQVLRKSPILSTT